MRPVIVLGLGCVAVLACGGKTLGGDETDGGSSSHDASSGGSDVATSADSPFVQPDTSFFEDVSVPPGIVCTQGPSMGSSSSGGACEIDLNETCSDGTTYEVSCQCPGGNVTGTCSCSQMSGMSGGSGGGSPLTGCPTCPGPDEAWNVCGFPH